MGFADILRERVDDDSCQDAAETIQRNGQHLLEIINDILDLSKIESGSLELEKVQVSPRELIQDVISLMQVRADAKGIQLKSRFDGDIPASLETDPTRLRQVLINIIGNAVKFTEHGLVEISSSLVDSEKDCSILRIDVIDSGIGMSEEALSRIFQPFVQADTSTTRSHGGTGLGLTITKRLVEMLGGDVSVNSTLGHGTTVSIRIATGPLSDQPMPRKPSRDENQLSSVENGLNYSESLSARVLLAEDGPDNQRLLSFVLKKAGMSVELANDGKVALTMALAAAQSGNPFDVILMDMQMPVMDGYTATRQLRQAGYKGVIIALTAHAMAGDNDTCIAAGCDAYATKPIDRNALISLISGQLPTHLHEPESSMVGALAQASAC